MSDDLDLPDERPCRFCGALPPDPRFGKLTYSLLAQVKEMEAECARLRERVAELEAAPVAPRPRVVCLVGSSRFKARFHEEAAALEKQGVLVLMMGFFQHADGVSVSPAERAVLRRVDRYRIDLADEVRVLNVGGYVGQDTAEEIAYAASTGKPLTYLEAAAAPPCAHDWEPRTTPAGPARCRLCGLTEDY